MYKVRRASGPGSERGEKGVNEGTSKEMTKTRIVGTEGGGETESDFLSAEKHGRT